MTGTQDSGSAVASPTEVVAAPADQGGGTAASVRGRSATSALSRNGAAVVALVVVLVIGFVTVPTFGSVDNLRNVAVAASFIAISSAGMTFVIISGGIDLSTGSTYGSSS